MNVTEYLRTAIPYDSKARRYARWAYEDTRNTARTLLPWRHLTTAPPQELSIETTNICNANCIFCAYQYQKDFRAGNGVMKEVLFVRVLDEYEAMGGSAISFTPIVGDPLVDPNIIDRVALVQDRGLTAQFYTNGILFNRIDVEALIRTGIKTICLSTSPFDRESHERVYRTTHYSDLIEGVVKLLEARNRLDAPFKLLIEFRSDLSTRETLAFPDFMDRVVPLLSNDEVQTVRVMTKVFDTWGGQIAKGDLEGEMALAVPPKMKRRPCFRTFLPEVLYDGKVRACSCVFAKNNGVDADDGLLIGDLNESSLADILFGENMAQVRERFVTGDIPPVCQKCSIYRAC